MSNIDFSTSEQNDKKFIFKILKEWKKCGFKNMSF